MPSTGAAIVSLYRILPGPERDVQAETVVHDLLDDLQLHRAHQLQVHFL